MNNTALAQSANCLLGYSGLIVIPSASIARDGEITLGISRIPELYATRLRPYDRTVFYGRMGFLPFLEASFAIVRPDDYPGGAGDRTVGIRVNFKGESEVWPAVSVGMHDFFASRIINLEPRIAQHFAALYIVGSKSYYLPSNCRMKLTAGYGVDWLPAKTHQLVAGFCGTEIYASKYFSRALECDARKINLGGRITHASHLQALIAWWEMRNLSASLSYSYRRH